MSRTAALSTASAGAPLTPTTIERRDLRDDDITIDIAFAGICHSDIHQVREEWGTRSSRWSPATRSPESSPPSVTA